MQKKRLINSDIRINYKYAHVKPSLRDHQKYQADLTPQLNNKLIDEQCEIHY